MLLPLPFIFYEIEMTARTGSEIRAHWGIVFTSSAWFDNPFYEGASEMVRRVSIFFQGRQSRLDNRKRTGSCRDANGYSHPQGREPVPIRSRNTRSDRQSRHLPLTKRLSDRRRARAHRKTVRKWDWLPSQRSEAGACPIFRPGKNHQATSENSPQASVPKRIPSRRCPTD